jgi:hypothetical protein
MNLNELQNSSMTDNSFKGNAFLKMKSNCIFHLDNHYFSSKVNRFINKGEERLGPGNYEVNKSSLAARTFNRGVDYGYIGSKETRFQDVPVRPKIGPGSYEPAY